jgi:hypothetical protein
MRYQKTIIAESDLLPWSYVMRPPSRIEFARHLRNLRRIDPRAAIECARRAIWVGCYPIRNRLVMQIAQPETP